MTHIICVILPLKKKYISYFFCSKICCVFSKYLKCVIFPPKRTYMVQWVWLKEVLLVWMNISLITMQPNESETNFINAKKAIKKTFKSRRASLFAANFDLFLFVETPPFEPIHSSFSFLFMAIISSSVWGWNLAYKWIAFEINNL